MNPDNHTSPTASVADEIIEFLDRHAGVIPDFDPDLDDQAERYTGPDSAMLHAAAQAILDGDDFVMPHSSWGSGCYRPFASAEGRDWHDSIIRKLMALKEEAAQRATP